jgi:tellurite resistance protein TehA-like permease
MSRLATMPPGYFALVMATGILSIGSYFLGLRELGLALLWINVVQYLTLIACFVLRFIRYRPEFIADILNESRVVSFLTASAGTFILGSQFVILLQRNRVGTLLWIVGIVLWIAFVSAFFTTVITRTDKPTVAEGITGATLILVVATEGMSVLGTLLAASAGSKERILFICLAAYTVGAILYLIFITLIMFRWMFFSLDAGTLTPSYWINMGALAITTLAGSRLILSAGEWSFLQEIVVFVKGVTFCCWSMAAWWIPFLIIAGLWRHGIQRVPIRYDPQYWSLVFPLGMFTVATILFEKATGLTMLHYIPFITVCLAWTAWIVTFVGMLRSFRRASRSEGS